MVHLLSVEFTGQRMPGELARFEATVKELGDSYTFVRNVWIVQSERTNQEICERLAVFVRPGDRLLVTRIHRDWAGLNIADVEAGWMSARNYASANGDDEMRVSRVPMARQ